MKRSASIGSTICVRGVGRRSLDSTGNRAVIDKIAAARADNAGGIAALADLLKTAPGHFAAIIEGPDFCCAFTDHCRTTPVFYAGAAVSNDAHALRNHCGLDIPDPAAVGDVVDAVGFGLEEEHDGGGEVGIVGGGSMLVGYDVQFGAVFRQRQPFPH